MQCAAVSCEGCDCCGLISPWCVWRLHLSSARESPGLPGDEWPKRHVGQAQASKQVTVFVVCYGLADGTILSVDGWRRSPSCGAIHSTLHVPWACASFVDFNGSLDAARLAHPAMPTQARELFGRLPLASLVSSTAVRIKNHTDCCVVTLPLWYTSAMQIPTMCSVCTRGGGWVAGWLSRMVPCCLRRYKWCFQTQANLQDFHQLHQNCTVASRK